MPTVKALTPTATPPAGAISTNANTLQQLLAGLSGNVGGVGGLPAGTVSYPNTLAGSTQGGQGAYGTVPTAANPQQTQAAAVAGNEAIEQQLAQLTQQLDTATAAGAMSGLSQNLPGAAGLIGQATGNVSSNLAGQLSPDVMALLNQQAAEGGVSMGSPGSPASEAAALRAMGLTSQQLKEQGLTDMGSLISAIPKGLQFDPSTMLVTPGQQLSQQQLANTLASAPDPTMAAQADLAALAAGTKAGGAAGGAPGAGAPTTTTPGAAPNPDGFGAYTGGWLTGTNTSPYGAAGTIPGSTTTTTPGTTIGSEDWLNQFYDSGNVTPGAQYPTEVGPGITDTGVTGQQYTGEIGPGLNMGETGTGTDYFDTSQLFDEYGNYIGG